MPSRSEIYEIPGNADLSAEERLARAEALYIPFHDAIRALIRDRTARGQETRDCDGPQLHSGVPRQDAPWKLVYCTTKIAALPTAF